MKDFKEYWDEASVSRNESVENISQSIYFDGKQVNGVTEKEAKKATNYIVTDDGVYIFTEDNKATEWLRSKPRYGVKNYESITSAAKQIQNQFAHMNQLQREQLLDKASSALMRLKGAIEPIEQVSDLDENGSIDYQSNSFMAYSANIYWPEGAYLYKHCSYGGTWIYMPFNSTFPHLSLVGMNDAVSSVKLVRHGFPFSVNLFEHGFYTGRRVTIVSGAEGTVRSVSCFVGSPYYFNDKASSVFVSNWAP
ncbi:MAG: hypothetical protein A2X56_08645 [Nitrospirae bacterium GWC2_57_13]|jgi:hypothetical protein|nr:MAG: hypothetical protein A2072_08465 [Nitrospirae bacterium GWC1_57_7]OGW27997.1 MAG: hypothetical protein A2X56_08645 [Nitrospirae bacterium GWC2_57_13]OGW42847.1 MAG: hypothetical protein A2X57_01765 [Nitrospirae bacterium GWD2_57_8]HAR45558.1 hypothetical protein [Nitrospiraceae bacterium]HAS53143.1 hypothetical protein [Nitrospiraceae bacterium]